MNGAAHAGLIQYRLGTTRCRRNDADRVAEYSGGASADARCQHIAADRAPAPATLAMAQKTMKQK